MKLPEARADLMEVALVEAAKASEHGDVPVGAVVIGPDGAILAQRHNERELTGDPSAHAEVLALRDAAGVIGGWHLEGCELYVTLEPCLMCAGAALNARLARIVYGAADPAAGACYSLYNVCGDPRLNHEIDLLSGVEAERCGQLLTDFFAGLRR